MRFIGNKEKLLGMIYQVVRSKNIQGNSFFDFFAGTTNVGRFFKKLNYQIYSSDLLHFSYVLQQAYIVNNRKLKFKKLVKELNFKGSSLFASPLEIIIEYLNQIKPIEGFIYKNYTPDGTSELEIPRMYFSGENGKLIDAIRQRIEEWKDNNIINKDEYFVLLACLIETVPFYANVAGVFAAFQKQWDPRAVKKFVLRPIKLVINGKENFSFEEDSANLIDQIEADIFYLDPPYNQRQYAPNYHLLETIARYDDPVIRGVSGLRNYDDQKSKFCNATTAVRELSRIAEDGKYKTLMLSYNTEGIMKKDTIISTLKQYGNVDLIEFKYLRFKSNNNGESKTKKYINEQLYILNKTQYQCV